jgi:hypothetical protein
MSTRAGVPAGDPVGVKFGSPHVVDHGPENIRSPDGALYMVAGAIYGPLSLCVVSAAHDGSHDGAASAHFVLTLCEFVRTGGCLIGQGTTLQGGHGRLLICLGGPPRDNVTTLF